MIAAVLVALAVTRQAPAPSVPTVPAPAVESQFARPFGSISNFRPLSSNAAIIHAYVEAPDNRLRLTKLHFLDWSAGTVQEVPGWGRGPLAYGSVHGVLAGRGDTTLIVDGANWRLLKLDPAGRAIDTRPFPTSGDSLENPQRRPTIFEPDAIDTGGNLYERRNNNHDGMEGVVRDSSALRRWSGTAGRADTLEWIRWTAWWGPGGGIPLRLPHASMDDWAVTPGGEVVVVRADPYRVDRISPSGAVTRGPPIPHQPVRVTRDDRRRYIAERRRGSASVGLPDDTERYERAEWPTLKPPFNGTIVVAPDGEVWIPTTPARDGDPIVYDVIAGDGTLRVKVAMPPNTVLLTFGPGAMYTTQTIGNRIYLQRRPWTPAR